MVLPQAIPDGFRSVLSRFKTGITKEEYDEFQFTELEDVHDAIHQIQEKHGSEGKMQNLARLQRFLEGMEQYGKVVEVFLNSSQIIPFVWGPVKFLLLAASTWADSLEALLDAYEQIGDNIPQFLQYEALFRDHPHMRSTLNSIYEDILEFHRRALKFFMCRGDIGWRKLFLATWKTFKTRFQHILDNLRRRKSLIESQASLIQFEQLELLRISAEKSFSQFWEAEKSRKLLVVTEKLNAVTTEVDQEDFCHNREILPQAGRWIFEKPKMKSWIEGRLPGRQMMWISGIPGAGKTVLASLIIEETKRLPLANVSFFYCKHNETQRNTMHAIVKTLLAQLVRQNELLIPYVYEKISHYGEITLGILKEITGTVLRTLDRVFLIIDGLDECPQPERKKILSWLNSLLDELIQENVDILRVLIVSQDEGDIRRELSKAATISLKSPEHRKDIEFYIQHKAQDIRQSFRLSLGTEKLIIQCVTKQTEEMFLFAKLVLENLEHQTTQKRLLAELQDDIFPKGIDQAFDRIFHRLYSDDGAGARREDAMKIFGLMLCATRPMKWKEIQGVFAIDPETGTVDFEGRTLLFDIKDICGSFVDTRVGGSIEFAHATARQYLSRRESGIVTSNQHYMALLCLNYLAFDCFREDCSEERIWEYYLQGYYCFQDYAVASWMNHLKASLSLLAANDHQELAELSESVRRFLDCHSPELESSASTEVLGSSTDDPAFQKLEAYGFGLSLNCVSLLQQQQKSNFEKLPSQVSNFGVERRVLNVRMTAEAKLARLATDSHEIQMLRSYYGPETEWFKCSRCYCHRFYDGFPSSEARTEHYLEHERPFHCTFEGCPGGMGFASTKDLKRHNNSLHKPIESATSEFPKPRNPSDADIFHAAKIGDIETVKELVEEGIDLRKPSRLTTYDTPLVIAARNGRSDIIDYILSQGVGVDEKIFRQTALYTICCDSATKESSVERLLELGASPNSLNPLGETPFLTAVRRGNGPAVRLLRRYGASLEVTDLYGYTALHRAILTRRRRDSLPITRFLLEEGVDPNRKTMAERYTALHQAVRWQQNIDKKTQEDFQIVSLLLDFGADVNAKDRDGNTPLHRAANWFSRQDVVELLVAHGARLLKNNAGKSPLDVLSSKADEAFRLAVSKAADNKDDEDEKEKTKKIRPWEL